MSASAIANSATVEAWQAQLARPPFVDPDKSRAMADGAVALQMALQEGFTDFVVIGLTNDAGSPPDAYRLKVFSRPRTRPVLMHIMQTADSYITECLGADKPI